MKFSQISPEQLLPNKVRPPEEQGKKRVLKRIGKVAAIGGMVAAAIMPLELPSAPKVEEAIGVVAVEDMIQGEPITFGSNGFGSMKTREYEYDLPCTIDSIRQGNTATIHQAGKEHFTALQAQAMELIEQTNAPEVNFFGVSEGGVFVTKMAYELLGEDEDPDVNVKKITISSSPASPDNIIQTNKVTRPIGSLLFRFMGFPARFPWRLAQAEEDSFVKSWNWAYSAASTPKSILSPQYELAKEGILTKYTERFAKYDVEYEYLDTITPEMDNTIDGYAAYQKIRQDYINAGGDPNNVSYHNILRSHGAVTWAEDQLLAIEENPNSIYTIKALARDPTNELCGPSYRDVALALTR